MQKCHFSSPLTLVTLLAVCCFWSPTILAFLKIEKNSHVKHFLAIRFLLKNKNKNFQLSIARRFGNCIVYLHPLAPIGCPKTFRVLCIPWYQWLPMVNLSLLPLGESRTKPLFATNDRYHWYHCHQWYYQWRHW